MIGLPAAFRAAVAGANALASRQGRIAAGAIALVSVGLSAAAAFLKSNIRQSKHALLPPDGKLSQITSG
jgi:hypothetical protein